MQEGSIYPQEAGLNILGEQCVHVTTGRDDNALDPTAAWTREHAPSLAAIVAREIDALALR
jgi:hypothetical protein